MISGFRCEVDENCALLSYYAACSANFLPTFRDNLSAPSSKVIYRSHLQGSGRRRWNPIGVSRNVGKKYPSPLRNNPEEPSSHVLRSLCLASPNLFVRPPIFLPFHPALIMQLSWQNGCLCSKATSIIHVLIRTRGLYMWSLSIYVLSRSRAWLPQ